MRKSDWIGLGTSIGVHVLLLLLFSALTAIRPQPQPLGFIEVEFGDFARGRPVAATPAAPQAPEAEPDEEAPPPETETEPREEPPREEASQPVDLPEQAEEPESEDNVPPPEEEAIPPAPQEEPAETEASEDTDAQTTSGADTGDAGEGTTEEKTAPYDIEGLNRDPVFAPVPRYAEKVDATIRVRITVDPRGRIASRIPLIKGNPELERAVMDALQRWRFNALPANAPQEPQTGVITFRFRLE